MKIKKIFYKLNLLLILTFSHTNFIFSIDTNYDQIINRLNHYFNDYNLESYKEFLTFLEKDLANYPTADNGRAYISNPDMQAAWINGTAQWTTSGFKPYISKMNELIVKYSDQIKDIIDICKFIIGKIDFLQPDQQKQLLDNQEIMAMDQRIKEFIKLLDASNAKITEQIANNLDTTKTFLSGDGNGGYLDTYRRFNENFEKTLLDFKGSMIEASKKIQKIYTRINTELSK